MFVTVSETAEAVQDIRSPTSSENLRRVARNRRQTRQLRAIRTGRGKPHDVTTGHRPPSDVMMNPDSRLAAVQ